VTLTGPGGVGKTRLALALAAKQNDTFTDGVAYIELAAVANPGHVAATILQAMRHEEGPSGPAAEMLAGVIGERDLLLVLDNFEHLLPAAPLLTNLLTACPCLTILVTSRARLRLSGEHDFPLAPLAFPDLATLPRVDELSSYGAIQLWVERAKAANPAFSITAANAATIAMICHRLDGLPLAIELAAARIPVLSPAALLDRLEQRLPLLTGGPQDAPARLRTMRDAIVWSHDLLTPEEQALFRHLAVFSGGFTLEAAEAAVPATGRDELAIVEGVTSLVGKSLLRPLQTGNDARFAMLETIREFALEQLSASGEEIDLRDAHAAYFLGIGAAESLEPADRQPWLQRVESEIANIRSALDWLRSRERIGDALRLVTDLARFWTEPPYVREGRTWLATLLACAGSDVAPAVLGKALLAAANLAIMQRDYGAAEPLGERALELGRAIRDDRLTSVALGTVGYLAMDQGRLDQAFDLLTEARAMALASGTLWDAAEAVNNLARVATERGSFREAIALHEQSLAEWRHMGDADNATSALGSLAWLYRAVGEYTHARDAYEMVLDYAVKRRRLHEIAAFLTGFASLAYVGRSDVCAVRLFAAAETLFRAVDLPLPWNYQRVNDEMVVELRRRLGEAAFFTAWADGERLTLDEAVAEAHGLPHPVKSLPHGLSSRQVDVLRLLAERMTDREIADRLFISRRTVSKHVEGILDKLGVPDRRAAGDEAKRLGLA
jgi:non-specific serine/threonine protein kinase